MKSYKLFLICFFCWLIPAAVSAQRYNLKTFSVNKGLPHPQVHSLLQTSDGFMWAGTYGGGLARFNGTDFTTYSTQDGLKNNSVEFLYESRDSTLWISTYESGVGKMEEDSVVYPFEDSPLNNYTALKIDELRRKGEFWIGTTDGGFFISDGNNLQQITTDDGLLYDTVWDFWEAENGNVWIATQRGISIYNGESFQNITTEQGFPAEKAFGFMEHPTGNLWIATDNGIAIWDGASFSSITEINGESLGYVFDLITDANGDVWIGTERNGVFVSSDSTYRQMNRENGLSSNMIYDLHEDNQDNIWIGTNEDGITLYSGDSFKFYGEESGIQSPFILSMHQDQYRQLWVGTYEGIFFQKGDQFEEIPFPDRYEKPGEVWDIEEFSNGNLLFLMPDNALFEYDGSTFSNYSAKNNLDLWFTYDVHIDDEDELWLGTSEGFFHYSDGELQQYTVEDGLAGNVVQSVFEYKDNYWLATRDGLSRFDGTEFSNITTKDGLGHKEVTYITADDSNNLWLGTAGGVSYLSLDEDGNVTNIENFDKDDGLKLTTTQFLWFDQQGFLWQGTNGGLHKFHVPSYHQSDSMEVVHYPLSNNGIGVETNHKAVLTIDENTVWFGTMEGALKVDTHQLHRDNLSIPTYITGIDQNSKPVEELHFNESLGYKFGLPQYGDVQFPYSQDTYTFYFTALGYGDYGESMYRYRLEGFEESWSESTDINRATYTNLDPGDYTFTVQARVGESSWDSNQAKVNFSIDSPFWQSYWFYGVLVCLFGGFVYGYIQFRLNRLEKEELENLVDKQTQHLTKALEEKEVLIKEIHHRVKNNLAVISGLLELQMGYAGNDFVSRVLSESQRRVQSISMIHEKLYQNERLSEINFEKYVRELIESISYSFSYPDKEISVDITVDDFKLGIDQGIPCGLILNEVVSNAFEHAFKDYKEGNIIIRVTENNDEIELVVMDDGCGLPEDFEPNKSRESLGITLIETLSQQLQAQYKLENTGEGTRFVLEFSKEQTSVEIPA